MGSRFSYFFKIQFLLIIFAVLPSLVVSFISFSVIKNIITEKIKDNNQQLIEVIGEDLKRTIDDIAYASNYFVRERTILESLVHLKGKQKITSSGDYNALVNVENFIALSLMKSEHLKSRMFIVTPSKLLLAKDSTIYAEIHNKLDDFHIDNNQITNTQIYWLPNQIISQQLGDSEIYHYAARMIIHPVNGEVLGTLYIGLPKSYFTHLFAQANQGDLYLTDSQGHIIASNGYGVTVGLRESLIKNSLSIPKAGWNLIYETPQSEMTGEVSKVLYYSIVLIAISLTIFVIASVLLAVGVHKPIHKLKRVVQKFTAGNRSIRIPVRGNDEIAVFGRAFNTMLDEINQLISNIEQEQEEKKQLELQTLFAQIRPHFLINTLFAIRCNLQLQGDTYHSELMDSLMKLLRGYMRVDEAATLEFECRLLHDYVKIMEIKNGIEMKLDIDLPASLHSFEVPRLLLQPIVENAIIHGFSEPVPIPIIQIRVAASEHAILIEVSDNGIGLSQEELYQLKMLLSQVEGSAMNKYEHLGLANTLRRLKLTYGEKASMDIKHHSNHGLTFMLHIPVREDGVMQHV